MTGKLNLPADGLVAGGKQLVLSGGNVGIGTTGPSEKLQLKGTAPIYLSSPPEMRLEA